jgi:YgiT-type zinc finger domain-containing protein
MSELCPKCRRLQNLKATAISRKVELPGGKTREIKTVSYHCEACGAFIRSEETQGPATDE